MTRTYRLYVDQGITDRMMNWIHNVLPTDPKYVGRLTITNFYRTSNPAISSYFECELVILIDGTEIIDLSLGEEKYYKSYMDTIAFEIQLQLLGWELIFDSGRPTRLMTHKYDIEPAIIVPKTHLYNILEFITQTMTHSYDVEI